MRVFIGLLVIAVLLAVAAFAPKAIRSRDQMHAERLLGALKVIERTVEASSDEIHRIGLYAPKMRQGAADNGWRIDGVVTLSDALGDEAYREFAADLVQTCPTLLDAKCWQIDELHVGTATLVSAGQRTGSIAAVTETSAPAEQAPTAAPGPEAASTNDVPTPPAPATPAAPVATTAPSGDAGAGGAERGLTAVTADIQQTLQELGYNPGPSDGVMGPRTVSAILAYQRRHGLQMDGLASPELLAHLRSTAQR